MTPDTRRQLEGPLPRPPAKMLRAERLAALDGADAIGNDRAAADAIDIGCLQIVKTASALAGSFLVAANDCAKGVVKGEATTDLAASSLRRVITNGRIAIVVDQ